LFEDRGGFGRAIQRDVHAGELAIENDVVRREVNAFLERIDCLGGSTCSDE
jgi:hypothetical protein